MAILPFTTKAMTAVDLLRTDHERLKALFRDFEAAEDTTRKQSLVQEVITELDIHATVEEEVFYPAVRRDSPDAADQLDESFEEHHVAKFLMGELMGMSPEDKRFDAKFRVLVENVRHHIKEEEAELFARARTGRLDLVKLGREIESAKASYRSTGDGTTSRSSKRIPSPRKGSAASRPRAKQTARKTNKRTVA
ncbi:MAG TPA: hemerythrin domain-containing protein [Nitrospiraceae bacterium]|nr:hemerythrin domain-containing protein [Nitrospiraceae bacterium]